MTALSRTAEQRLWSPEQIAGWLKRTYPDDETFQVSHDHLSQPLHTSAWRLDQAGLKTTERALQIAYLGSWQGTCRPQADSGSSTSVTAYSC